MDTINLLKLLGLSENEARVYLALLKHKKATVSKIADEAHVNRSSAYDILKYLNDKGLVLRYVENRKTGFLIDTPKRLRQWIAEEKKKTEERDALLAEHFNSLAYLFKMTPQAPNIRYFEGHAQLEDFFIDSLMSLTEEIIGYASATLNVKHAANKFIRYYTRERSKRNIRGRYFVQETDKKSALDYWKKYYKRILVKNPGFIKLKILPYQERHHFLNETTIYGNKLSIAHVGNDFFGVIIENEDVSATQRIIFESLWKTVKEEIKI